MLIRSCSAAFVVTGLACVQAQSDWVQLAVGPTVPTARGEHAMVADLVRGNAVLFGGREATGAVLADTWIWDGVSWAQRTPAHRPPARRDMASCWDPARGMVVVFGGYDALGTARDDLWAWNGLDWTRLAVPPQTGPSARAGSDLSAGPADGSLVLFGGIDDLGVAQADTWVFDGTAWSRRSPAHSPSPRFGHRLAPDLVHRRAVLFGGHAAGSGGAETWEWDGSDWLLRGSASAPGLRVRHGMAFDAARARVVLHGGTDGLAFAFGDTWEWDGTAWLRLTTAVSPRPVLDAALCFDPGLDRLLRFGGFDGSGSSDACWSHGAVQPARITGFGAGCGGSAGVPRLRGLGFGRPWLGETFTQLADRMPPGAPMVFQAGFSRTTFAGHPLPLTLDFLGMTGCSLHASIDALTVAIATGGTSTFDMTVPSLSVLTGSRLFAQALVIDPTANPAGVTTSNALELVIGRR